MKLKLADNTTIECTLNGNNYITTDDVSDVDFSDENFKTISVDDVVYTNQHCSNVFTDDEGTHIIFRALTKEELINNKLDGSINSEVWTENKSYDVNDCCIYNNRLYACILHHISGSVTPDNTTYWQTFSFSSLLKRVVALEAKL